VRGGAPPRRAVSGAGRRCGDRTGSHGTASSRVVRGRAGRLPTVPATLRPLGPTGLSVHPVCLGGNVFGWTLDGDEAFAVLDRVLAVAAARGAEPAQVAVAWVLAQPGVTSAIASVTSLAQLETLRAAADLALSEAELARLGHTDA